MRKSKWRQRDYKRHSRWSLGAGLTTALLIILAGLTFAALQSPPAKLSGNNINTATAGLLLSLDGTTYATTQPGFTFNGLVPGGAAMPDTGNAVYIRNNGDTPLALKFAVTNTPSNPANVDLSKVNVILTPQASGTPQSFSLQSLITANATGGLAITDPNPLFPGNRALLTIKVSMNADALSGPSANLGNIDFAFTGVAQ